MAFGGHFDLVDDVVEDGLVDVEDAGAERCLRWFLGGPMARDRVQRCDSTSAKHQWEKRA